MNRNRVWWFAGAAVSGLAFAFLPDLSLRWYLLYPYPLIPVTFRLLLSHRLGSLLADSLSFAVGCGIFTFASPTLARGKVNIGKGHWIGLGVLTALQSAHFIDSWRDGVHYWPGPMVIKLLLAISIVWVGILWLLLRRAWIRQNYSATLTYHLVLVMWLVVYAFPWLGEML